MKKIIFFIFLILGNICSFSQPTSLHYKKQYDFFYDVMNNPDAAIYQFLMAGLNSKNTELRDIEYYRYRDGVQEKCRKMNMTYNEAYNKIKACWGVFLEVEHTDLSMKGFGKYMIPYHRDNAFAPKNCPNPELKHKLSIVPLKLKEY